jgi:hypothetical protein
MKFIYAIPVMALCARVALGGVIVTVPGSGWSVAAEAKSVAERPFVLDEDLLGDIRGIGIVDLKQSVLTDPEDLFIGHFLPAAGNAPADGTLQNLIRPAVTASVPAAGIIGGLEEPLSEIDFLLEGKLSIDWSGESLAGRDESGFQLQLTQIPEPASILMVVLVSVSGIFIRRRFR